MSYLLYNYKYRVIKKYNKDNIKVYRMYHEDVISTTFWLCWFMSCWVTIITFLECTPYEYLYIIMYKYL